MTTTFSTDDRVIVYGQKGKIRAASVAFDALEIELDNGVELFYVPAKDVALDGPEEPPVGSIIQASMLRYRYIRQPDGWRFIRDNGEVREGPASKWSVFTPGHYHLLVKSTDVIK